MQGMIPMQMLTTLLCLACLEGLLSIINSDKCIHVCMFKNMPSVVQWKLLAFALSREPSTIYLRQEKLPALRRFFHKCRHKVRCYIILLYSIFLAKIYFYNLSTGPIATQESTYKVRCIVWIRRDTCACVYRTEYDRGTSLHSAASVTVHYFWPLTCELLHLWYMAWYMYIVYCT